MQTITCRIAFSVNYKSIKNKANYSCTHSHVITLEDVLMWHFKHLAYFGRMACMNGHIDQPIKIECPLQTIQKQIIWFFFSFFVCKQCPLTIQFSFKWKHTHRITNPPFPCHLWRCTNCQVFMCRFLVAFKHFTGIAPFFILSLISGQKRQQRSERKKKFVYAQRRQNANA